MKLTTEFSRAPFIHYQESTRTLMIDVILPLLTIYAMAYYHYGPRVVLLGGSGILSALFADVAGTLISRGKPHIRDLSPVVTGMIVSLLMPASVPLYVPVIAAAFGILVAKHPFGGLGHNIFNPAAAGFAFVAICFPEKLFAYPAPNIWLPLSIPVDQAVQNSPAFTLNLGGLPTYEAVELVLGNFPGPMGATNILVILACLLFLLFRGTVRWETPVVFLLTTAVIAFFYPRADISGSQSVLYELAGGFLLFGGVFMLGDPVTSPIRSWVKALHAALAGVMVMLFRRAGNLEDGFLFALLVLNVTVWGFDMTGEQLARAIRRKKIGAVNRKEVQKKT